MAQGIGRARTVIAFYGISDQGHSALAFFRLATDWFSRFGVQPEFIGGSHSKKVMTAAKAIRIIEKNGWASITQLGLYGGAPNKDWPTVDCLVEATIDIPRGFCYLLTHLDLSQIEPTGVLEYGTRVVADYRPCYGIGFRRSCKKGPGYYAMGVSYGETSDKEGEEIAKWGVYGVDQCKIQGGLLRDVYPLNFLTSAHLERCVEQVKLLAWIAEADWRGTVSLFQNSIHLWRVPAEGINPVRKSLSKSGIVF